MFRVELTAWYWTPTGELRECLIVTVNDEHAVLDAETLEEIDVAPEDTLVERPEP